MVSRTDFFEPKPQIDTGARTAKVVRLGRGTKGMRGTVVQVGFKGSVPDGFPAAELERRLLEIGFVEGADVEIVHEGFIGRDPIAVRLDDMWVGLRRCEAEAVLVGLTGGATPGVDAGR
jgi:ferrous iron transport protein A